MLTDYSISVPCGVFVFLNRRSGFCDHLERISVPCGVFVFLNRDLALVAGGGYDISVPCGVFVFLNESDYSEDRGTEQDFRPLRGLRVSQSMF